MFMSPSAATTRLRSTIPPRPRSSSTRASALVENSAQQDLETDNSTRLTMLPFSLTARRSPFPIRETIALSSSLPSERSFPLSEDRAAGLDNLALQRGLRATPLG